MCIMMATIMIMMDIAMVLMSLVLVTRFAMRTEAEAKMIICRIPLAISGKLELGLSRNVTPSTIRKKAMINLLRIMISTLPAMFSAFFSLFIKNGTPGTIRTCGLQFRKLTLYPAELRVHRGIIAWNKDKMNIVFVKREVES